jgi:hypothetical protein
MRVTHVHKAIFVIRQQCGWRCSCPRRWSQTSNRLRWAEIYGHILLVVRNFNAEGLVTVHVRQLDDSEAVLTNRRRGYNFFEQRRDATIPSSSACSWSRRKCFTPLVSSSRSWHYHRVIRAGMAPRAVRLEIATASDGSDGGINRMCWSCG